MLSDRLEKRQITVTMLKAHWVQNPMVGRQARRGDPLQLRQIREDRLGQPPLGGR